MKQWEQPLGSYNQKLVQKCVSQKDWQLYREALKGLPTERKLDLLQEWLDANRARSTNDQGIWVAHVQVTNYIYALRRGGFLSSNLTVVR